MVAATGNCQLMSLSVVYNLNFTAGGLNRQRVHGTFSHQTMRANHTMHFMQECFNFSWVTFPEPTSVLFTNEELQLSDMFQKAQKKHQPPAKQLCCDMLSNAVLFCAVLCCVVLCCGHSVCCFVGLVFFFFCILGTRVRFRLVSFVLHWYFYLSCLWWRRRLRGTKAAVPQLDLWREWL